MRPGYIAAIVLLLLCGWRAWVLLRDSTPLARSLGTVFSAVAPFPVFLVVIVYHYASRRPGRHTDVVVGSK